MRLQPQRTKLLLALPSAPAKRVRSSFDLYQRLQPLSGESWEPLKLKLLKALRQADAWNSDEAKVTIFLHEEMWEDAIATVSKRYIYNPTLVYQVMDAVMPYQPDWVIVTAIPQADEIINAGRSDKYNIAIEWLKRVKAAYVESERQAEWQTYRNSLVLAHGKKRKLMALLDAARLS